jgi:hypothetical protein
MSLKQQLGPSEITRLKDLVMDGVKCQEEIESMKEGMTDTIKAISEELDIPAKLLKKAISIAYKHNFADHEEELSTLDEILTAIGQK